MAPPILTVATAALFLLFSAFFSGSETALFSIPRERIASFEGSPRRVHRWISSLLRHGQQTLMLILLGNMFVNVTVVGLVHQVVSLYVPHNSSLATLFLATCVILVFGEILPKNIALRYNEVIAVAIAPALYGLQVVTRPVLRVMQSLNTLFLRWFALHLRRPAPYISVEELRSSVDRSVEDGALTAVERGMIARFLDHSQEPISRAMVHRSRLTMIPNTSNAGAAVRKMVADRRTFSIVTKSRENGDIEGVLYLSDVLGHDSDEAVAPFVQAPTWVPESIEMGDLVATMVTEKNDHVCVLDEFGTFAGVFALRNGLEHLACAPEGVVGDASLVSQEFSGFEELSSARDWIPPSLQRRSNTVRTMNGLLTSYLGRIPRAGERFAVDDWIFYIKDALQNRIVSVVITKKELTT